MTQDLLFGECFALVALFIESRNPCWIKLFPTKREAKEFGIEWLKRNRPAMFRWPELDVLSVYDQWDALEAELELAEWMFVEAVEVVPRIGVTARVGVFSEV